MIEARVTHLECLPVLFVQLPCCAVATSVGTELVGTLTAYSTFEHPFTANEVALFKMVGCLLAPASSATGQLAPSEMRVDRPGCVLLHADG